VGYRIVRDLFPCQYITQFLIFNLQFFKTYIKVTLRSNIKTLSYIGLALKSSLRYFDDMNNGRLHLVHHCEDNNKIRYSLVATDLDSVKASHIHRISNDGKIVENRAIRDDLTFMMQLGIVGPSSLRFSMVATCTVVLPLENNLQALEESSSCCC
jgi:hypothetical protein